MKREVKSEKDILWVLGRKETPRLRFVMGSGGVESVLVDNQLFSKKQADQGMEKIYGKISEDPFEYMTALKTAGVYERISSDKARQKTRDYIV